MKVSEASDEELNRFIDAILKPVGECNVDFINSGDGLKMMLERFPSIELRTYSGVWSARRDASVTTVADTLGRAVAEAFALDNGWKE